LKLTSLTEYNELNCIITWRFF